MKPDWKDAPEWANYLAMNGSGWWFWFKEKPFISEYYSEWLPSDYLIGGSCRAGGYCGANNWLESLEQRP